MNFFALDNVVRQHLNLPIGNEKNVEKIKHIAEIYNLQFGFLVLDTNFYANY